MRILFHKKSRRNYEQTTPASVISAVLVFTGNELIRSQLSPAVVSPYPVEQPDM